MSAAGRVAGRPTRPTRPTRPRARIVVATLALALAAAPAPIAGCGGARPAAHDPIADDLRAAQARLKGRWSLASFRPDTALDPLFETMLTGLQPTLVITFEDARVVAIAPGITFDRRYEVKNANGDQFTLVSYDDKGIAYESVCEFRGDAELVIHSRTSPWRGTGVLRRAP